MSREHSIYPLHLNYQRPAVKLLQRARCSPCLTSFSSSETSPPDMYSLTTSGPQGSVLEQQEVKGAWDILSSKSKREQYDKDSKADSEAKSEAADSGTALSPSGLATADAGHFSTDELKQTAAKASTCALLQPGSRGRPLGIDHELCQQKVLLLSREFAEHQQAFSVFRRCDGHPDHTFCLRSLSNWLHLAAV